MNFLVKIILLLGVISVTAGMSSFQADQSATENTAADEKVHGHSQVTAKPHAPINLQYKTQVYQAGIETRIQFTISSAKKVDDLSVIFFSDNERLFIENAKSAVSFGAQQKNQLNDYVIKVVPEINGEYLIHLRATITKNDKHQSRSFVIPVTVGQVNEQKSLRTQGEVTTDEEGRAIISMPAVETAD